MCYKLRSEQEYLGALPEVGCAHDNILTRIIFSVASVCLSVKNVKILVSSLVSEKVSKFKVTRVKVTEVKFVGQVQRWQGSKVVGQGHGVKVKLLEEFSTPYSREVRHAYVFIVNTDLPYKYFILNYRKLRLKVKS